MQSSGIIGLRVAVLLAGLIGLPLLAMLGMPNDQADVISSDVLQTSTSFFPREVTRADPPPSSLAVAPEHIEGRSPSTPVADRPTQSPSSQPVPIPIPVGQNARMAEIQRRLRELGATYYLLEKWGSEGKLYRFHCRVAIGEETSANRHFEVVDADSIGAIERVLTQIEAWRATQ